MAAKSKYEPIKSFEPLTREQLRIIVKPFTAVQAIAAGLNFIDYRYGAGVINETTKCVWTRTKRRVTIFGSHGTFGASLSKDPDPACPELSGQ